MCVVAEICFGGDRALTGWLSAVVPPVALVVIVKELVGEKLNQFGGTLADSSGLVQP